MITKNENPCPVNSYNEWDPLEEIIVGRAENGVHPPHHITVLPMLPHQIWYDLLFFFGGRRMSYKKYIKPAQKALNELVHVLEAEGVTVRRPDIINHRKKYKTPHWKSRGFVNSCPRDCFLVIGNEIIEAPMSWRCRYFERHAYYQLFKEYFELGAKWTSAPKPPLMDSLYDNSYKVPKDDEEVRFVLTESEVVFDAADFTRCGRDIFVIQSNVTNQSGINWLRRHLGDEYRVHEIQTTCKQPLHIDTTFVPLGPGKLLINPKYINVDQLPSMFKNWDILEAPEFVSMGGDNIFKEIEVLTSSWLHTNVLMLDENRVICEKTQEPMIKAFKNFGLEPIPVDLAHLAFFGGSFHCVTLDIRRRGKLNSYF